MRSTRPHITVCLVFFGALTMGCSAGGGLPASSEDMSGPLVDRGTLRDQFPSSDVAANNDACTADTRIDPKNCGSCGNVCPGSEPCAAGKCVASDRVLILYSADPDIHDLQDPLSATGAFAVVDAFDASQATPTPEMLARYDLTEQAPGCAGETPEV